MLSQKQKLRVGCIALCIEGGAIFFMASTTFSPGVAALIAIACIVALLFINAVTSFEQNMFFGFIKPDVYQPDTFSDSVFWSGIIGLIVVVLFIYVTYF